MAGKADLTRAAKKIRGKVSFHWVDTADHGYRPLKASGRTADDVARRGRRHHDRMGGRAARLSPRRRIPTGGIPDDDGFDRKL